MTIYEISTHKAVRNGSVINVYIKGFTKGTFDQDFEERNPDWFKDELILTIPFENRDDLEPMFDVFEETNRINLAEANC